MQTLSGIAFGLVGQAFSLPGLGRLNACPTNQRLIHTLLLAGLLAAPATAADLPKVLLLGGPADANRVAKLLDGKAVVVFPGGPTPDVVHFGCDPGQAASVARLREMTPSVVAASADPADVAGLKALGVPVNDLSKIPPAGHAEAVADSVLRQTYAKFPPNLAPVPSGPEAAAKYRKAEAAADADVPAAFRSFKVPEFAAPADAADWAKRRPDVKAKVVATLGDLPPRPSPPKVHLVSVEHRPGYRLERIRLDNGVDGEMSAMLLVPDGLTKPAPAVLWLHSSSYDHRQLLAPNKNGGPEPLGEVFVKRGWVVFAPDAAWYGDRDGAGPAGPRERTKDQQLSQAKWNLWLGRTPWGQFVRDDQCALDYLCSRPEVDASKIGATGISMGSTRSWWLAAVDDRIAAVVGVACLTRYENLIRHGQLKAHGIYYFGVGLLKHFDTEAVVSLVAPRPCLFLTGDLDAGSPADGIKVIEAKAGAVYRAVGAGEKFRSVLYPEVGHTYTPEMRAEMLAWFDRWLK
jgi:dienelactone hydrolase